MQLREYIESWSEDNIDDMKTKDVIEVGRTKLFDFDYPIFDVAYKNVFETNFIRNFYMREIGFETEGLFKFQLETWLSINMPYFNQLFQSELLTFDPLTNTKITETSNTKNDTTSNQTTDGNGSSTGEIHQTNSGTATEDDFDRRLLSDNPDTRLTITSNDGEGVIEYASKIEENNTNNSKTNSGANDGTTSNTSEGHSESNSSLNSVVDYLNSKIGKVGTQSYSSMINEYRETFLRIEKRIFNEMQELFMLIY